MKFVFIIDIMPKLSKKGSPRSRFGEAAPKAGEAGVVHLLIPILILIGILATVYLIKNPQFFKTKPKASSNPADAVTVKVNGSPVSCSNGVCELDFKVDDTNRPVEFSIDVKALNSPQ